MSISSIIFFVIVVGLIFYAVQIYNQLVRLRNQYKNAFAQIDVQLKRRLDLVPNLVETAKAYLDHERETFEKVIQARNQAQQALQQASGQTEDPKAMLDLGQAQSMLSQALGKFNVVVEAYPELKANANMMQLSEQLISTENRIGFARQAYNDEVMEYNIYKSLFPHVLIASRFGHTKDAVPLDLGDQETLDQAPAVQF